MVVLALAATAVALIAVAPLPASDDVLLWQRTSYRQPGFDRSFKCDLVEQQSLAPQVVMYGGSRALRMPPSEVRRTLGMSAFNAAFHNGRPTDAWAFTNFLIDRQPAIPPLCLWCVQVNSFVAGTMHQGLILDERLSRYFPSDLIAARTDWAKSKGVHNLLSGRRYSRYGTVLWNSYDVRFAAGVTLDRVLTGYLDADMLATAGNRKVPHDTMEMRYFEKTLKLLNQHGVKPLIVIMPYHPRVLSAFMRVGWGVKESWLRRYLDRITDRYRVAVLDCLDIRTFGGTSRGFYDGSHLTADNSRRLLGYCIRKAPGSFKLHPGWLPTPTPTPSPTGSSLPPSPGPSSSASSASVSSSPQQ